MRIVKEPEVRKAEILAAAEKLFVAKGYNRASVNDIIKAVGLSKGAFYYYFKSKEEVLNEILEKQVSNGAKTIEEIVASPLPPLQKFLKMIFAQQFRGQYERIVSIFREKGYSDRDKIMIHKRSAALNELDTKYILRLGPYVGKVVEEGIEAGLFSTPFPVESVQILLSAGYTFFHYDYLPWTEDEVKIKIAAFLVAMERILGAKPGTFSELQTLFPGDIFHPDGEGG
jgi:AcrR family transcriptional regulator